MIFTKRVDYGLRAAMELAAGYGSAPLSARRIARRGGLPEPFVRKLLQQLARAGLADSQRGRCGGYLLARPPDRITVRETLEAFETLAPVPCLDPANLPVAVSPRPVSPIGSAPEDETCALDISECSCPTRAAWHLVDTKLRETLDAMSLDDLLAEVRRRGLAREMIHASD